MSEPLVAPLAAPFTVGVSLKMYFGHAQTLAWAGAVADIARRHPAVTGGVVDLFVAPSTAALAPVGALLAGTGVRLAAQNAFWEDAGAFTGETSPAELAELGCSLVELGHAERRRHFGETDTVVSRKVRAAIRNGLAPLLCLGENDRSTDAASEVIAQLDAALADSGDLVGPIVVAYEPVWAIGAAEPAPVEHVVAVVRALEARVALDPARAGSRVIYGGSAAPGLLTAFDGAVRGLFLGRFAHDPAAVELVLDEALALAGTPAPQEVLS
ncbi:triose-phosphate isomerase [Agromyces atrinae]|uniref:triose-phosphate isomerase family protein n=1 Tax=Agromyces atrinae TaxID=592376 RepID=UPI001F55B879|nr:triose-phosphate isomerase family protein [Agromyces atrinae]MCI2957604.1 triose-phosphate isomerase [Agromyces atrinae]